MEKVKLTDICRPKQWKTISTAQLKESGYPVYGANGKIGFYNEYTHEFPTLLITCRGATCGTVNISEPKSYVNGNAMALDNLSKDYDLKFLYHYFGQRGFNDVISGSAQPQITRENLSKVEVPKINLATQQRIAAILDQADAIIQNNRAIVQKYDALTQSLFLDMFGDPVRNEKGWEKDILKNVCTKITDGTHDTPERLNKGIKFITGKHIKPFFVDYENSDYVTKEIHMEIYKRCNPEFEDILYTNIGVNFATAALNVVDYEFSMKNVALLKYKRNIINGYYLTFLLNNANFKDRLKKAFGIGGAQQFLSLSNIKKIEIHFPPIQLQNQFAERVAMIEAQKQQAQLELAKSEELFASLLQRAFNGELN